MSRKNGKPSGGDRPYEPTSDNPAHRPKGGTLFKPEMVKMVGRMAELGLTDMEIAKTLNISERSLHKWKLKHPELADALVIGKEHANRRVERSLYLSAVGYEYKAVKIHVNANGEVTKVPYIEHVPPDQRSIAFWLKNRDSDKWRDVSRTELTGKDGGPVEVAKLSDAEIDTQIRSILEKNPKLKEAFK